MRFLARRLLNPGLPNPSPGESPPVTPPNNHSSLELAELKRALLGLGSTAGMRRAGALAVAGLPSNLGLAPHEATAVLEIAACVARDASDAELTSFLRTGRLPDLISLTPRQMEHVRGGRMNLTASRGIAPELVLSCWQQRRDRGPQGG